VAVWAVTCTNSNSNIVHSPVEQKSLGDWFMPLMPEVPPEARITCEKCHADISFLRSDLRYLASA
jgi:hypothetical protein